tara:strand:- start:324 stop:806 length:483 start_codon:yes stop_codon:yes gene_type:complete
MDSHFLGLDCSSKGVHGVVINQEAEYKEQFKWVSKLPDFEDRFPAFLHNFLEDLGIIKERFPNLRVAIEAPIYIQNPKTTMQIAAVVYIARFICFLQEVECVPIQNKSWKKYVLERGNASKQDIFDFANIFWGNKFKEQDHADAACIALWGRFYYLGEDL